MLWNDSLLLSSGTNCSCESTVDVEHDVKDAWGVSFSARSVHSFFLGVSISWFSQHTKHREVDWVVLLFLLIFIAVTWTLSALITPYRSNRQNYIRNDWWMNIRDFSQILCFDHSAGIFLCGFGFICLFCMTRIGTQHRRFEWIPILICAFHIL